MQLILKPLTPAVKKDPPAPPKANPPPLSLPGKTLPLKAKAKLEDDISEEAIARMAAEMQSMEKALKKKKGVSDIDTDFPTSKKDLTWTQEFIAWGEKKGFKYEANDFSDLRMDLYKQDSNIQQLRLCIIRTYNHFNIGFYFNIGTAGYPKSLDFHMIRKAKAIDALNYMYNALSLFDEKE